MVDATVRTTPGCLARLGAFLITAYQRHISPHKGFRCAHRAAHGGLSCSAYAKHVLLRRGVVAAISRMRSRFAACAAAAVLLHATTAHFDNDDARQRARHSERELAAECCGNVPDALINAVSHSSTQTVCDGAASCADASSCADVGACLSF
jgi:putative component of membrane protein insertase Oxa1/YidC/SpoIIIJ protein YidD